MKSSVPWMRNSISWKTYWSKDINILKLHQMPLMTSTTRREIIKDELKWPKPKFKSKFKKPALQSLFVIIIYYYYYYYFEKIPSLTQQTQITHTHAKITGLLSQEKTISLFLSSQLEIPNREIQATRYRKLRGGDPDGSQMGTKLGFAFLPLPIPCLPYCFFSFEQKNPTNYEFQMLCVLFFFLGSSGEIAVGYPWV